MEHYAEFKIRGIHPQWASAEDVGGGHCDNECRSRPAEAGSHEYAPGTDSLLGGPVYLATTCRADSEGLTAL